MAFDSRIRNPLAPRRDSRVSVPQAEKITLPGVSGSVSGLCRVTATVRTRSETNPFSRKYRTDVAAARFRNQDRIPFRLNRGCFFLLRVRVTERERTASTARDRNAPANYFDCGQSSRYRQRALHALPTSHSHRPRATTYVTPIAISGFPCALGSTDSCSTTVHMKPFSASVLQDPSGVFATTTKICTDGGSEQARAHNSSTLTVATPLLVGASVFD